MENRLEYKIKRLIQILEKHRFWGYEVDELLADINNNSTLELVGKAHGDSYEKPIERVFTEKELDELQTLCKDLGYLLPEYAEYD